MFMVHVDDEWSKASKGSVNGKVFLKVQTRGYWSRLKEVHDLGQPINDAIEQLEAAPMPPMHMSQPVQPMLSQVSNNRLGT